MSRKNSLEQREVKIQGNEGISDSVYPGNKFHLSRYTFFTLIPKSLFEQFHRTSNLWFLVVAIFQLIPFQVNPTDSWTTILPLGLLLAITTCKDAYCDRWLRHKNAAFNNYKFKCWNGQAFADIKSQDLLVGQFVVVQENELIPADMIIITSTNEGKIFFDASKLIGYTNLEIKTPVEKTSKLVGNDLDHPGLNKLQGKLYLQEPASDYCKFTGLMKLNKFPGAIELNPSNCLFRGGIMKGEKAVIGLITYCGKETKVKLNIHPTRRKTSRFEREVNNLMLYLLLVLVFLVIFSVFGFYFIGTGNTSKYSILEPLITFTLLYDNITPISLFMIMDIIRLSQGYFLARNMKNIRFNTETVNENLGQIEYLLTDKTGCITGNKLSVKMCVIGDRKFEPEILSGESEAFTGADTNQLLDSTYRLTVKSQSSTFDNLRNLLESTSHSSKMSHFMNCMALCNDLYQRNGEYLGSEEEIALLDTARDLGFDVNMPEKDIYILGTNESVRSSFRLVESRSFTPERKRSRILLEDNEGSGILYVKGSPHAMLPLLFAAEPQMQSVKQHIQIMKERGLRIMITAYKRISNEEVLETKSKIQRIKRSLLNPESRIEAMFKELEKNLVYLGLIGVSETLLPGSVETISQLKKAGIKIWMTSSDSLSSSVLVAKEASIIEPRSKVLDLLKLTNELSCCKALIQGASSYILNENSDLPFVSDPQALVRRRSRVSPEIHPSHNSDEYSTAASESLGYSMLNRLSKVDLKLYTKLNDILASPFSPAHLDYSIVIDRDTFQTALKYSECRRLLTCLLVCAKSVCFVGLMPMDKGNVARLLKGNVKFQPMVAALGCGNSDINMVQASDVGIGISNGTDSLVNNYSDICVERFSQLGSLLLIEGHWFYTRISKVVLLFLYKNCFLTMVLFAYTFLCDFSGTSIFNASLLLGFYLFFTSFPLLVIGIFDEDVSADKIEKHGQIYAYGSNNMLFNWKVVLSYLTLSVVQGIILVVLVFVAFPRIINPDGMTEDINILGTVIYITLVYSVLIQIHLSTFCYTLLYFVSQVVSIILLIIFISIISQTSAVNSELLGVGNNFSGSPISMINILITSMVCILPSYALSIYGEIFFASVLNKIRGSLSLKESIPSKLDSFKGTLGSLYCSSSNWKNKTQEKKYSLSKITLKFKLPHIEKKFIENFIRENITQFKWTIAFLWLLVILWTIFGSTILKADIIYTLSRIIISSLCSVVLFVLWTDHFLKHYQKYILVFVFLAILSKFILEVSFSQPSILATALIPSVTFLILNVNWLYILLLNMLNLLFSIISNAIFLNSTYKPAEASLLSLYYITLFLGIILTSALVGYFLESSKRIEHRLLNKTHRGVEQVKSILSIMLPPFVRARVEQGVRYIADDQGEVTIIFCDICDFDTICKEYPPQELTVFLDSVFSSFDALCENLGVTKIETVGKTYMACSGLKDSDKDLPLHLRRQPHARRAIELALTMVQEVNSVLLKNENTLQIKIGINSGTVAAGVVGHHKPQFSLVGDTVNTASRMCSTLDTPNSIQISEDTYNLLSQYTDLDFSKRVVFAKGKGDINVYKVTEGKPDNSDIAGGFGSLIETQSRVSAVTIHELLPSETESETKLNKAKASRASKVWKENIMKKENPNLIEYHPLMRITCTESQYEKEFRLKRLERNQYSILNSLRIAAVTFSLLTIYSIADLTELKLLADLSLVLHRVIVVIFLVVIILLHPHIYKKLYYPYIIICCLILATSMVMTQLSESLSNPVDGIGLELMYLIVILNHTCAASLPMVLFVNMWIFVPWISLVVNTPNQSLQLVNALLVAVFSLINFKAIYIREKNDRANHNLRWLAKEEIAKNETLLIQMMPSRVVENLENGTSVTDRLMQVTLIFADIVGFTAWSSNKSPEEIVKMLSNLFTRFDKLCVEYDVYKVHTIGDCYVVMGDVGKRKRDPSRECINVMKMAYSMIDVINEENIKHQSSLDMRIGVHTGEVIAGIIGSNIVRYDIWGADVLIANKMESNGTPGMIKVSQDTKDMLESRVTGHFTFTESDKVEVPVIGVIKPSYYVKCDDIHALDELEIN